MNTLGDLNMYLFEQMERLSESDVSSEEFTKEIERGRAMSGIAKDIISNANIVLQAEKFKDERMDVDRKAPRMLEG